MKFSWDLIHTFDTVAKTGSLLAAARVLGVSQPTVGRHIDLLEEALNVSLFVRSRDGMALTEAGGDLVATSSQMVDSVADFKRRSAGLDDAVSGTVRLSANEILGVHVLPGVLRDFLDAQPDIDIELDITNSAANLSRREADIALRMFEPTQPDLIARRVSSIDLGFYASRTYLERHGRPEDFAALKTHRMIGFDRELFQIHAVKALGERLAASDFRFRCDHMLSHVEGVRAGLGIGILHTGLAAGMEEVERLLARIPLPSLGVWIAYHSDLRYNPRIRLMVAHLMDRLRQPYGTAALP